MDRRVKERLVGATILVVLIVMVVPELLSGPKARVTPAPAPSAAGPAEAVRNVTVDLATSKATPAQNPPADNTAASTASPLVESTTSATGAADSGKAGPGNTASGNAASGDATTPGEALASAGSAPGEAAVGAPSIPSRANRTPGPPTIATLKAQQPAHTAAPDLESEPSAPRSASQASKPGNASAASPPGASNHHWAVQLGSFSSHANAEKLVRQLKGHDAAVYISPSGKGASVRYRVRMGPMADRNAAERMVAKLKKEGRAASLVPP